MMLPRRLVRAVATVAALVVVLGGAISAATPAAAMSIPWVPPSMGTGTDVRGLVTGSSMTSAWSSVRVTSGAIPAGWHSGQVRRCAVQHVFSVAAGEAYWSDYGREYSGVVSSQCPVRNSLGWYGGTLNSYIGNLVQVQCSSSGWRSGQVTVWGANLPFRVTPDANSCPGETVVAARSQGYQGWSNSDPETRIWVYLTPWSVDWGLAPVSVTVTCLSGSTVTTQTAASAGSTVERPDCPAGSSLIGVSVSKSGAEVASWTPPTSAISCTVSGTCTVVVAAAGVPCVAGMTQCDWWDASGTASEASGKGLTCWWQADPTMALTAAVPLVMADCEDAKTGGQGGTSSDTGGGTSEDEDTNLITKAIAATREAIVQAVNRVKTAVDQVTSAVEKGLEDLGKKLDELIDGQGEDGGGGDDGGGGTEGVSVCGRQPITNWLNPAEWVYDALECAFVPSEQFLQDASVEFQTGLIVMLGDWGPPGDGQPGVWDDMAATVESLGTTCSCGWWDVTMFGGTYRLLDTCTDTNLQWLRDLSRGLSGGTIVVAGILSCGGLMTSALGLPFFRGERGPISLTGSTRGSEWRDDE